MNFQNNETLKQIMFHIPLYRHALFVDTRDFFREYPDLKHSHIHAIMFLMVSGETTMTHLAQMLRLEKGSVTAVAERLVSAGLAERQTDPGDRRKAMLRLTAQGRALAEAFREANARQLDLRIGRLSDAEQVDFVDSLIHMNELLRRMFDPEEMQCIHQNPCSDNPSPGKSPGPPSTPAP